jgi:hypothetical protein
LNGWHSAKARKFRETSLSLDKFIYFKPYARHAKYLWKLEHHLSAAGMRIEIVKEGKKKEEATCV